MLVAGPCSAVAASVPAVCDATDFGCCHCCSCCCCCASLSAVCAIAIRILAARATPQHNRAWVICCFAVACTGVSCTCERSQVRNTQSHVQYWAAVVSTNMSAHDAQQWLLASLKRELLCTSCWASPARAAAADYKCCDLRCTSTYHLPHTPDHKRHRLAVEQLLA
jgi:hypothetical protein